MYHPTRGGVRGGRDQFKWDDVKVDKHRENYLGHSIMAPVGRWQKGKDLHWYARDKKGAASEADALKEEIRRVKEEEEHAMREALGLAPKRNTRPQGNRLDKHEYAELVKRGSTAEDMGGGHAEAAQVQGLGLYKGHRDWAQSSTMHGDAVRDEPTNLEGRSVPVDDDAVKPPPREASDDEDRHKSRKKQRHEDKREDKRHQRDKRQEKHDRKRSHDPDEKHERRKDKSKRRRHDSDSD